MCLGHKEFLTKRWDFFQVRVAEFKVNPNLLVKVEAEITNLAKQFN